MEKKHLTNGLKIRLLVHRFIVSVAYYATSGLFVFLVLLYSIGSNNSLYMYIPFFFTPCLISTIYILITNNTFQDYFCGINYQTNIRLKLILKILIKHSIFIFSLYLFNSFSNIELLQRFPFLSFVCIIPAIVMTMLDIFILDWSVRYISIFNLILNIKNDNLSITHTT
jgi:hypothetical protein